MARILAFCNQKGGVGKTTTAVNVAGYLASAGKRTLLIDLDAQGNATIMSGGSRATGEKSIYGAIVGTAKIDDVISRASVNRMDICASSAELSALDQMMAGAADSERALSGLCAQVAGRYDAIVLDCPPSLGVLTINALTAAEYVIVPVQCEYLSLEGLTALTQTIDRVKRALNPRIELGGIVLTMVDARSNLTREVAEEIRKFFKELVFETTIPRNVRLAESPSFGKPIVAYDPHSTGAVAYERLTNEVLERIFGEPAAARAPVEDRAKGGEPSQANVESPSEAQPSS